MVKNPVSNVAPSAINVGKEDKTKQSRDKKVPVHSLVNREDFGNVETVEPDPVGFREQVSMLFADWYRICELPSGNDAACTHFILQLHQNGLLKGDDMTDLFFRVLTELSVEHCISSEGPNPAPLQTPQQAQSISFLAIDIYAKLVFSILKGSSKLPLLSKILVVTVRVIQKDAEEKKASFSPRPYFRLFVNWLLDLGSLDPVTDGANFQILTSFVNKFYALQPLKVPTFRLASWNRIVLLQDFVQP